jgi:MOSC domain-containing protein YiiM
MPGASVLQVNVSGGGVPKLPVREAEAGELGLAGDGHDDALNHGGPERALCLFAIERIEALAAEGHPLFAGAAGENVTTRGLDWDTVVPGTRLRLGAGAVVEITRYTTPCRTIAHWFADGDFTRIHQDVRPGWSRVYARVLRGGVIRPGDAIETLPPEAGRRQQA